MFLLRKIVSQFFFPMPICLLVCFIGLALLWWTRRQKFGKVLVTIGLLLLTALSYGLVADALMRPLENEYPAYVKNSTRSLKYVVVLGAGHNSDPRIPLTSQIDDESLKRLAEGVRVYRQNPGSKLVLSGGSWLDPIPGAKILAETAKLFGIDATEMVIEAQSMDTQDEARLISSIVTTNAFALVTSASHMRRAMGLFERVGMMPEPAPTEHLVRQERIGPATFFPRGRRLRECERAFYEYLGIAWSTLTGQI